MLLVDHAIDCSGDTYASMQVYASVMIAVLPVGFGLAALVGLWQLRHILREANEADMDEHPRLATSPLRPLFGSYKPVVAAWYDVLDMGRRIVLTCVTGEFGSSLPAMNPSSPSLLTIAPRPPPSGP